MFAAVAVVATILALTLPSHGGAIKPTAAPVTATSTPSPPPATPAQLAAQKWQQKAERTESPAGMAYISMVELARNWQLKPGEKNKISGAVLRAQLVNAAHSYAEAQAALNRMQPYPPDPRALDLFRQSVRLYSTAAALTSAATYTPAGALRDQVLLSVTRVRQLGDKVYDDANATLKPLLPPPAPTPGLHFDPEAAVPTWATVPASDHCITVGTCPSVAAGPPLAAAVPVTPAPTASTTPATQSLQAWQAAIAAQSIPDESTQLQAVDGSSAGMADQVSAALASAQAAIAAIPYPTDATVSATLQLDLLIRAEAARTAQEADLVSTNRGKSELRAAAGVLAGVGDALGDGDVGNGKTALA
jgi:hypothetical protein